MVVAGEDADQEVVYYKLVVVPCVCSRLKLGL